MLEDPRAGDTPYTKTGFLESIRGYKIDPEPFRNYNVYKTYVGTKPDSGEKILFTETNQGETIQILRQMNTHSFNGITKMKEHKVGKVIPEETKKEEPEPMAPGERKKEKYEVGYMIHEAPQGRSLHEWVQNAIRRKKRFHPDVIWHVMKELFKITSEMALHGYYHGAISPDNIYIDYRERDQVVTLIDYAKINYIPGDKYPSDLTKRDPSDGYIETDKIFTGRDHREIITIESFANRDTFHPWERTVAYSIGVCMYVMANLHWPWPVRGSKCSRAAECVPQHNVCYLSNYVSREKSKISSASINYMLYRILYYNVVRSAIPGVEEYTTFSIRDILREIMIEETGCRTPQGVMNRGNLLKLIPAKELEATDTLADLCVKYAARIKETSEFSMEKPFL